MRHGHRRRYDATRAATAAAKAAALEATGDLPQIVESVAFSPSGTLLAAGTTTGGL
jgi:hypothetical protein